MFYCQIFRFELLEIKRRDRFDKRTKKTYTSYYGIIGGDLSNIPCKQKPIKSFIKYHHNRTGFKVEPIGKGEYMVLLLTEIIYFY